jgi:hypothetical protein
MKPAGLSFNEKPTYIKAIATRMVVAKSLLVKYFDSSSVIMMMATAATIPEIASIISFCLKVKNIYGYKDAGKQNYAIVNNMSETDRFYNVEMLSLFVPGRNSFKN